MTKREKIFLLLWVGCALASNNATANIFVAGPLALASLTFLVLACWSAYRRTRAMKRSAREIDP